jgi:RNA polymerase sigma factor (TIGR02999 family)
MRSSDALRPASFAASGANHTLQPTALVHEAYMRLVDQRQVDWQNRAHFFGVAANVMRRILVDHARRHSASKRGEGVPCMSLDEAKDVAASDGMPVIALDQALDRLEKVDAELARIVELRAFWRAHDRGSGTCAQRVPIHCQARLAHRESVAHS